VLLSAGANPNLGDRNASSPVLKAAGAQKGTACLALLLAAGADANAHDARSPALMFAVSEGAVENVRLLLEHGGNPNFPMGDGWTILHAAYGGMTEELIKHGANINANGAIGTPLHRKVEQLDFESVKLLVTHGADVNLRNPAGKTPLDLAADAAKEATNAGKPSPEIKEMIRFLSAHGAKRGKA
jgi:ankyrin repeat protein